jgi:TRAP-type mannitol/chloroaromatic compound transport system substrate-binding protein
VLEAQLKAWDTILANESKDNPDFAKIIDSQKKWAQKVYPWTEKINIPTPDPVSYNWFLKK